MFVDMVVDMAVDRAADIIVVVADKTVVAVVAVGNYLVDKSFHMVADIKIVVVMAVVGGKVDYKDY